MTTEANDHEALLAEVEELRLRLARAEENLHALQLRSATKPPSGLKLRRPVRALRQSEEFFRTVLENTRDGINMLDLATGRYVFLSPAQIKMTGFSAHELHNVPAEKFYERVHPEDLDISMTQQERLVAGLDNETKVEYRWMVKSGEYRWFSDNRKLVRDPQGRPVSLVGVSRDITVRKRAEEALRESESEQRRQREFLEYLIANVGCCLAVLTGDELRYALVNPAYQALAPDEQMVGRSFFEVLPAAAASAGPLVRRVLDTGEPWQMEAFPAPVPSRPDAVWRGQVVRLPAAQGTEPAALAVIWEITDLVRAEEALKQLNEELELRVAERTAALRANMHRLELVTAERIRVAEALQKNEELLHHQSRLAALGEMIADIAHQWRQPLNALGLLVQETHLCYQYGELDKPALDRKVARSMALIQHMSHTIDDFRNFFKPDKQKVAFSVRDELAKALSLVEAGLQQIAVEVEIEGDSVIYGYPNEFSQVLLNILINARDAIAERGVERPKLFVSMATSGERTSVTIADNAGGIPEAIIGKVFDPYFTTKGPQAGTGVGLFMCKTIIEKNMGGSLTVRNTDEGAEFRIEVMSNNYCPL